MTLTLGSVSPMATGVVHIPPKSLLITPTSYNNSTRRCSNLSSGTTLSANFKKLAAMEHSRTFSSIKTSVAAFDSDQISSSDAVQQQASNKYYFVVANAKFMLDEEEHFRELMFERLRYFGERNKEQDFWIVIEPKFLDKFPNITKRLGRPAVALVSTNGTWIRFMKLRLDRVLLESYESNSLKEALSSNPVNIEFQQPQKWVAPYPKYETGWWEAFLPPGAAKPQI